MLQSKGMKYSTCLSCMSTILAQTIEIGISKKLSETRYLSAMHMKNHLVVNFTMQSLSRCVDNKFTTKISR